MKDKIQGKAYVVGNDIDTDVIIPARYLNTMDPAELGPHAMEDLDPKQYPVPFLNEDGSCDYKVIVAGKNFGCGSSREHAPMALAENIEAVVAESFARIYFRNSVNGGIILPLESTADLTDFVETGDQVEIDLSGSPHIEINGRLFDIKEFGPVKKIIEAGGLTAYNKKRLGL
ncbi:3-isopropylmalate dehydratase small subunit [Candidatus Woesearchaeota archaeon]|nr:3-isopropylmalate dehydratase small subunit [Candidatus Woesearchaeota archaeon]